MEGRQYVHPEHWLQIAIILIAYVFIIYCIKAVNTGALCIFSLMEI
jgi:hypothetical protein